LAFSLYENYTRFTPYGRLKDAAERSFPKWDKGEKFTMNISDFKNFQVLQCVKIPDRIFRERAGKIFQDKRIFYGSQGLYFCGSWTPVGTSIAKSKRNSGFIPATSTDRGRRLK
jgi:hypothetical protein